MAFGFKARAPGAAKSVYDFEFCEDQQELRACIDYINANGHRIVSVTENQHGGYTVFFFWFGYG